MYDMFTQVGNNNQLLINQKTRNKLGGSLSDKLTCGSSTGIKTVYSEKLIPTEGMEYIEIITTESATNKFHIKMFVSKKDFQTVKKQINVNDNLSN